MRVCIDAGHGGRDPGAIGRDPFELMEKEFNLACAEYMDGHLRALGHEVIMTRRRDRYLALESRANFANQLGADLFISVHANASATTTSEGMEVFHFPGSSQGNSAATLILNSMLATFPNHVNRGVKEANYVVLRLTDMTAVLVECEFLSNPTQLLFLADAGNQNALARAIAAGANQWV